LCLRRRALCKQEYDAGEKQAKFHGHLHRLCKLGGQSR
jgi:hypothetical protein